MFAAGFAPQAFAVPLGAAGYVGPVSAQRMLLRGFPVEVGGEAGAHWLKVGGRVLIGPAGKVYAFRSADSAAVWLSVNTQLAARERAIAETLPEAAREVWLTKKRAQLLRISGAVIDAAARCKSPQVAAALVAESNFCLDKWGQQ